MDTKEKIHYLVHYNTGENEKNRYNYPATNTKARYMIDSLIRLGYEVNVISACENISNESLKKETIKADHLTVSFGSSHKRAGRIRNAFSHLFFKLRLLAKLCSTVKNGEKLLVYHSLSLMPVVKALKRMKRINVILEMEEIYGDVVGNVSVSEKEKKYAEKYGDAYILVNHLLKDHIRIGAKRAVVSHGSYKAESFCEHPKNEKIHVVYAGTADPHKGGIEFAIDCGKYLSDKYHLHILSFGNQTRIDAVKERIRDVSSQSRSVITYDGTLQGEEYIRFLQSCDIGLSTQNPNGIYNDTSFPSKILVYLANGLRVVSVKIPAIESSDVNKFMYYYDCATPERIAEAIMNVDLDDGFDGRRVIKELDDKFLSELKQLLLDRESKTI